MSGFSDILSSSAEFNSALENITSGKCPIHITGMTGSQKSHFIYSLCVATGKKCLVITSDEAEAGRISSDLSFLFCRDVFGFKNKEYVFHNIDASSHTAEISRLRTLSRLSDGVPVVTTCEAISKFTVPPELFYSSLTTVCVGDTVDIDLKVQKLVSMGYSRTPTVEGVGQFSVRGSIIDIFSPSHNVPVRIDLFDDEVDSIREFDAVEQVSTQNISECHICPVREIIYDKKKACEVASIIKRLKNENLMGDAEKLEQYARFASLDKYMSYFYNRVYYIDSDALVFVDEAKQLFERSKITMS